jgi:hypothetical protein
MRSLLSFVFRLVLLAVFTFGFVVLFEHGQAKFADGAKTEWNALLFFIGSVLSRQENVPPPATTQPAAPPATSQPAATPVPTPVSGTSPSKGTQASEGTNRPARGTPGANH